MENGAVFLPGKLTSFHPTQSELIVEKRKEEGFIIYGKLSLFMRREEEKRANRRFFFFERRKKDGHKRKTDSKRFFFLKKDIRQTSMQKRAELTSVPKELEFFLRKLTHALLPEKEKKSFNPAHALIFPPVVEVKTKA